ncbi:MAG: ABC transporter permease [Pseudomonadota bacterium]
MKKHPVNLILPWIIPMSLLIFWFAAGKFRLVPSYLLPPPHEVGNTGYEYIFGKQGAAPYSGRFLSDAAASLVRIGLGFFIATATGIPLGILSGRMPVVRKLLSTTINGLRAVPGITWLPLAMIWLGIGLKTTIFLIALAAFFPIYLNTASGAVQVNPILLQAGDMMGIKRFKKLFFILIPGMMPDMMTGLRLGLGISWAYLVLGELTGVPNGLGAVIMDARMLGRIDMIVVGIIIIAVMGRLSDMMLKYFLKICFKSAARMT